MFPSLEVNGAFIAVLLAFTFGLGVAFGYAVIRGDARAIFRAARDYAAASPARPEQGSSNNAGGPGTQRAADLRRAVVLIMLITSGVAGVGSAFLSAFGLALAGSAYAGVAAVFALGALLVVSNDALRTPASG